MKITTLVENTSCREGYTCVHGLSFYVETEKDTLLFDLGPDNTVFENAKLAGIDLSAVDKVVISHGHYDHGGAMEKFLSINQKARIYVREDAFEQYFSTSGEHMRSIGLKEELKRHPQVVLTSGQCVIGDGLRLFSEVKGRRFFSEANKKLLHRVDGELVPDAFEHEQNLVICEGDKKYLIAGCAHNGIVNILEEFQHREGKLPEAVISGFHLKPPSVGDAVDEAFLDELSRELLSYGCMYYTCHCTGLVPYEGLKKRMGNRIEYAGAGSVLEV